MCRIVAIYGRICINYRLFNLNFTHFRHFHWINDEYSVNQWVVLSIFKPLLSIAYPKAIDETVTQVCQRNQESGSAIQIGIVIKIT